MLIPVPAFQQCAHSGRQKNPWQMWLNILNRNLRLCSRKSSEAMLKEVKMNLENQAQREKDAEICKTNYLCQPKNNGVLMSAKVRFVSSLAELLPRVDWGITKKITCDTRSRTMASAFMYVLQNYEGKCCFWQSPACTLKDTILNPLQGPGTKSSLIASCVRSKYSNICTQ